MRQSAARARQDPLEDIRTSVLLDTLGLAATIEWHVRRFYKRTGVLFRLTVNDVAGFNLPEDHATTLFELYTRALTSVARHAAASRVAIALTITPHEVIMVVRGDALDPHNAGMTVAVNLPMP